MSEKNRAQSLSEFVLPERRERFERVARARTRSIVLVLDGVRNAHNISAVMRSADAFGIQELYLVGSELNFSEEISMGSQRWLDIHLHQNGVSVADELDRRGFQSVVLESPEISARRGVQSIPVYRLPFEQKLALIFGNELSGVSAPFAERAQFHAHIPMLGFVESFNISVAAAITMFCSVLEEGKGKIDGENSAGVRENGRMNRRVQTINEAEQRELTERWYQTSLRGGASIANALRTNGSNK